MDETQIKRIREYLKLINNDIDTIDKENVGLIDFCIAEVGDRVSLYLNSETIPEKLERILSKIVNVGIKKSLDELKSGTTANNTIASLSDNGQSISFSNQVKKYFSMASDEELFTGFTSLLSRYRRVKVVYPKRDENEDC